MTSSYFITGEWGSTFMRLHLCRRDGDVLTITASARNTNGVVGCTDFEAAFFSAAQPWFDERGPMPVVLAGMIAANIGWHDSGYAACPVSSGDLRPLTFTARGIEITLAPGLSCRNMFSLPDVVRGEDMQIFGWLDSHPRSPDEQHILCLPGRHVKWVVTRGHAVQSFFTGMNGELEDILIQYSLLGRGVLKTKTLSQPEFEAGQKLMFDDPTLSMGHALFATRSRLVLGEHTPETAASFLAGILIGGDIRDAVRALESRHLLNGPIQVFGDNDLSRTYAQSVQSMGREAQCVTEPDLAAQGLARILQVSTVI